MSTEAKCQENHYEEMLENEPMARTRVVKLCFPPHIQNRVSPLVCISNFIFYNHGWLGLQACWACYASYSVDSIKRTVLLNVLSLLSVLFSTVISKNLY